MAKLLLTGCRGNLAQAIKKWLAENVPELEVDCVAPFPFSLQKLAEALQPGSVKYFVNCAALGKDNESIVDPYQYYQTNTLGVLSQLEIIRKYSPKTRYLNLGSVYEFHSDTPYASSKRLARDIIKTYRENYGLYAAQATLGFTEYYHRDDSYLSKKIISNVVRIYCEIKAEKPANGFKLRDIYEKFQWTWAEDVADGIWRMLNQDIFNPNIIESARNEWATTYAVGEADYYYMLAQRFRDYTIVDPQQHTVKEFVEAVFKSVEIDPTEFFKEDKSTIEKVDNLPIISNISNLGWTPKTSFNDMISKLVKFEIENYKNE